MAKDEYVPFTGKLDAAPQFEPFDGTLDGEKPDGPLARGWNKAKQSMSVTSQLATGNAAGAAQTIKQADDYARANPGMQEGKELGAAWERGDGISGGISEVAGEFAKDWREAPGVIKGLRATGRNLRALGEGMVEQVPNMVAPVTGMVGGALAGGAAGSAAPIVGNVAGAAVGGWVGASAGNTLVEGGGMTQAALQKAGISPQDTAAVEKYLTEHGDTILGQSATKGAIIGAVDTLTAGLGGRLLNAPARAAASRALGEMGVNVADKAAVKAAMNTPEFAAKIASDATYQASKQGAGNIARNVGAAALDPAGEFAGEFVGQGVATGEWDAKNAALEALSSVGQSAAMFAGQKAVQAFRRPQAGQAADVPTQEPGESAGRPVEPPIEPSPASNPVLALPAPVVTVGPDGTARTAADRNARLSRIASGDIVDVTPIERAPEPVDPVRAAVADAAGRGGALSSAALTAMDTGAASVQPALPFEAPQYRELTLEEADAADQAAYQQFFQSLDTEPAVLRYLDPDTGIPDFDAASNASEEDFLRALGATDEDIQDAIATTRQPSSPQSSAASNAGPQAYEPAGPREGAGEGAASQTGQVNAGAIQQAAPDAPVPDVGGQVGADGAGSAAAAVFGASGAGGAGTGAATGSGAGATEVGSARAGGRGDSNQALNAPTNLRDALERVRQQKQEAANAQAAQAPAPAAAPVPGPAAATAVEAAGPTPDIKAITAKQIPDMTDGELQQAIAHYGPEHKRTAKLQKEVQRRAAPTPTTPTITQGTANVPQAAQAQQTSPQPTQAAAAPAAAAGLTDGAPTANTGAQAAPAPGPQAAAPAEPEFTTIKTVYGDSVTVRTDDLNSDKPRLRQYTKDGKSKAVPAIHRDNLDLTGDKRKASAKEDADNPFFNVITTKDGSTFASQAAASRELNRLSMGKTHEVVAASEVQDGAQGFVIRRKPVDAMAGRAETGGQQPAAPAAAELSLDEQLKQVNDQLANRGPVQNARTREKRDQLRKAIAERDFPAILKAVDGDIDSAEAINQALQYAGDEPKAKVIERVLKNRGITAEYRQRWAERLMDGQVDELDAEMQSYEAKATASLRGKAAGDMLEMGNGTLYRISGIDTAANRIRLVRNPDQLNERTVLVGQDDYNKLLADHEQTMAEAMAPAAAPAPSPGAEKTIQPPKWWTDRTPAERSFVLRASGVPGTASTPWERLTKDQQIALNEQWGPKDTNSSSAQAQTSDAGNVQSPASAPASTQKPAPKTVRKAVDSAYKQQVSAAAPAPSPGVVNVPPAIAEALDADMQAQKARITRLRNAATADGMSLDEKKQAQTQLKGAEFTLQTMRRTRFDAEDAAIKAIEQKDMAPFAEHITFFKTEKALQELIGAAPAPATAAAPKKKPNADKTRAKADALTEREKAAKAKMLGALGKLAALASKNTRMNWTPEEEQKLLPIVIELFDGAIELGAVTFQKAVAYVRDFIAQGIDQETADAIPFETLQGAYIAVAGRHKDKGVTAKKEVAGFESLEELQAADEPAPADMQTRSSTLTESLYQAIRAGNMPKDNPALKKLVESFDGKPADPARMKQAQEELETAIAMAARDIVAKGESDKATFDALLRLYESQPSLNIRTSTSVANQAYSTPAPLAYLASKLAGINQQTLVHEPTGGTGMLLIGADPKNAVVNELNDLRVSLLKEQGFNPTQKDAAIGPMRDSRGQVDAVITNPPFGSVKGEDGKPVKVKVDGYNIGQIDHLIAAHALATMKDDGRAVLILGANKAPGGLSTDDRIFFNWLYSHYNVAGHFEVEGDLYARQGAGWPVRVIVINGREQSAKLSPVAGTIQRADNWDQVYEQFNKILDSSRRPVRRAGNAAGRASDSQARQAGVPNAAGAEAAGTGGPVARAGADGAGNVPGAGAGTVANRTGATTDPVGHIPDEQRLNGQSFVPPGLVEARPGADAPTNRPAKPAGTTAVAAAPAAAGNEFQTPYIPRSARKDEGVLIPSNMAQPTQDALNRLEDAVGDIDEFARKELGYESTEALHNALMGLQVDSVATAIYQIKQNKAVVIADQTGIGKGRQAASIIRWAARNGMTPVFVSVKPSLFTDMYGDLADIGTHDVAPFILNSTEWVSGADGEKLFANKPSTHRAAIQSIVDNAALPQGRNALFMTYSQINTANLQRQALMALAPNAVFVLDESHNAAGDSGTGDFMISVLKEARGVTYLSATYAKRPDNMPLYFKTDIGDAAADSEGLADAMAAGGLPLQTVVSNNLVKAGQMFRRERSYDGVSIASTFDTANRQLHERLSDEATEALRAIVSADKMFHSVFVKSMDKALKAEGSKVQDNAGNQVSAGVQHTEFSSVVHNFVRQMLLGLKAQTAADEAIASLKRGEKPIIAVENTMGSFLSEYAAQNNINQGDSLGAFDYRTVLSRALERSRVINVVLPTGDKSKQNIPLSQLDPITRKAYDHAQEVIDRLAIDIPVSPIDWMRAEIARAGFSVAEITGRDLAVDYSNPRKPVLSAIDLTEQRDKVASTRRFNGGELDALILNVAGSTGISLHASEKFADQRQRHMIVAQAAGDINIFMQMLGRVHRTGQVRLPKYTILSVDLPTEKRPTAVLSRKMKSLNANTSSNTESATSVKTADILNKYGDQIVNQYLADNIELARQLGVDDLISADGERVTDDIARKATGRLALQPIEVQRAFYEDVEAQYDALIEYLNKTNQNDLEPRTFDFDAKEVRTEILFDGPNKTTPFGEDAVYGEYSIKAQGMAMKPEEIQAAIFESLQGKTGAEHAKQMVSSLLKVFTEQVNANRYALTKDSFDEAKYGAYMKSLFQDTNDFWVEQAKQQIAKNGVVTPLNEHDMRRVIGVDAGVDFALSHAIGKTFRVEINSEPYNAVITNVRNTHKTTGNPFSLSKFQITIAVNGALRSITVPATQFKKIEVSSIAPAFRIETLFKEQPANQRETAKIVTGNLLAAYGEIKGARGTIISFTKADGVIEQGILLPKLFDFSKNTQGDYRLRSGADALKFLQQSTNKDIGRFGISTRDGQVRVLPRGDGVQVRVPKSKAQGARYFLDKNLIAVAGDFVSSANAMVANVDDAASAVKVLDLLMDKQALYALPSMAEEAKSMAAKPGPDGGPAALYSSADAALPAKPLSLDRVNQLVQEALSGIRGAPPVEVTARPGDIGLKVPAGSVGYGVTLRSGDIYVFQSAMGSDLDVFRTVFHELFHRGVRVLVPKGQYVQTMLDLAKGDSRIQQLAIEWKNTEMGQKQKENLRKQGYTGAELTGQYEALAIEEALAAVAEEIKAEGKLGSKPKSMTIRFLANWLAKLADLAGMKKLAQGIRAMTYNEAERFVMSAIDRSGEPVQAGRTDNLSAKQAAQAGDQTQTEAFKRWFKDSKAVDAEGKPLVVYHGTDRSFAAFDAAAPRSVQADQGASGFYLTRYPEDASGYASGRFGREGANVIPAYVSLQNPYVWPADDLPPSRITSARREELEAQGFDGIVYRDGEEVVAFRPEQVKSSIGNNGDFDPANADIRYRSADLSSRAGMADLTSKAREELNKTFGAPGKLSWWHKTVGTMYNLAERSPAFKRVFEAAQGFVDDVSYYATDAAEQAPRLLPKLETWRDIAKRPITAADNAAVAKPVFEGTLVWTRDEAGKPVRVDDLVAAAEKLTAEEKARSLLRQDKISAGMLHAWQGLPLEQYEKLVESRYESQMLKAGIVWTPAELKSMFKLTDDQVALYKEFRAATDRSLDTMARSDMLRYGGKDVADLRDMVMDAADAQDAAQILRDHLQMLAKENPERAGELGQLSSGMLDRAAKVQELQEQGYAPLSRFGKYTVDVVDANGERQYFGLFETQREANIMAMKMRKGFGQDAVSQGTLSNEEFKLLAGITPESLELFGNMLGLDSTGDDAQDQAFQEYLRRTKTNRSAMRRLIHRQGIAGYSEDVGRVLASFIYSNARQTSAGLHMGELGEAVTAIPKQQGELKDAAVQLSEYVKNPQEEAQAIRGLLFAQYLGGSIASAVVNMSQPAAVTFPWLSQFGGAKQAAAELGRAAKNLANKAHRYEADLAAALKQAEEEGTVSPQEVHQLMAQARGSGSLRPGDGTRTGDALASAGNALTRLSLAWGKVFGAAEQVNRRMTYIAAFRIAKAQKMANPAAFAKKAVIETQFTYSKANKMKWGRGAVGATVMTFKTYSVAYLELLGRMWSQGGPEGKKAVLLALGMLMLMGGAGGLPFAEDAEDLVDGLAQLAGYNFNSKKAKQELLESVFGQAGAGFVERGITGLPGMPLDVSGRLGMGNLLPGTGIFKEKTDYTRDVLEVVGPVGDLAKRAASGARSILAGDVGAGLLQIAPAAVRNAAKGADMAATGMYRDDKGYKVLDTSPAEAAMKAIGFQPASVAKVQEANFINQQAKNFYNMKAQEIRAKWARGIFEKDQGIVAEARADLEEWNRKNPEQRIVVSMPAVLKRVREMSKTKDQRIADTAPRAMRQQMREETEKARATL